MTWAPWRPFSGKTRPGGPSGRKPRRGRDGCRVPAGILFPSPRSCRSPAWRVCSSQSRPSSSRAASGLATPLPAAGETEARAVEWGGPVPLRTDLTPRGRTRLSQDECPMLPPEAVGLRRWRTLRHPRPQPPARPLTEPIRASRSPPSRGTGASRTRVSAAGGPGRTRGCAAAASCTGACHSPRVSPVLGVALNA